MQIIKRIIHKITPFRIVQSFQRFSNVEIGEATTRTMRAMSVTLLMIGSTQLSACGGGTDDAEDTPGTPTNFQATAKVANISVDSLSLVPGQTATIGMQAGQTLELDASASPVNWNSTSETITPVVDSNTPSVWRATMPVAATGLLVLNIALVRDASKTATLKVYVAPPTNISSHGGVEFDGFDSSATQIVSLQTTLTVPAQPPASGTLFLWPGPLCQTVVRQLHHAN